MPSFASGAKEMSRLARVWRTGNRAFNEIYEVLPKEPDAVYNKIVQKPEVPGDAFFALQECNQDWAAAQAKKDTLPIRRRINERKRELEQQGLTSVEISRLVRPLRQRERRDRDRIEDVLLRMGGITNEINSALKQKDAVYHKNFLVFCLGTILEPEER